METGEYLCLSGICQRTFRSETIVKYFGVHQFIVIN